MVAPPISTHGDQEGALAADLVADTPEHQGAQRTEEETGP